MRDLKVKRRMPSAMRKGRGHVPIRTCISCGLKSAKSDLVRLVMDEAGCLSRDDLKRRRGRGAYVCDRKECDEGLLTNKKLQRIFRREKLVTVPDSSRDDRLSSRKIEEFRDQDG